MTTSRARGPATASLPERPLGRARVLIVGPDFGFPNGTGAVSRVRCYATGLGACGADTHILIVGALGDDQAHAGNTSASGVWNGARYEYAAGTTSSAPTLLGRRMQEVRALRRLAQCVLGNGEGRRDAVVYYGNVPRWVLPLRILCSIAGVPLVQDVSEFPGVDYPHRGKLRSAVHRLRLRANLWLPDGFVVITHFLHDYLRPRVRRGTWLLRIPILVEASSFRPEVERVPGLIVYAGNLGHAEEIEHLVEAAGIVGRNNPGVRLEILGGASEAQRDAIGEMARRAGIERRVSLPGHVRAADMPGLLSRASVLVLARSDGLFSRAGMPTKLGEYLATGRPVVVTATGDIPLYLHDRVDSYLVTPGDVGGLAEAIETALTDAHAEGVGLAGRAVAERDFDPAVHMARLLDAIRDGAPAGS